MLKAAIFDMDGLLVDSEPLWRQAEQLVFPKVGIKLTDAMCMQTMGTRVDEVVRHWFGIRPWTGPSLEEVAEEIVNTVIALVAREGRPMDGVDYILEFFATRNFRLALASSSSMLLIDAVIDKLGIRSCFDELLSAEHEPYGKPHPGVFMAAAEKLSIPAPACLVFEDSFAGLIAGLAARMKVVIVPADHAFEDRRFAAAHLKVHSLGAFGDQQLASLQNESG